MVDDREWRLRGQNPASAGGVASVEHLVGALRALGEDGEVAGLELAPSVRRAQGRTAREDDQPLLAADLVVVGPGLLARRQLVDAAAQEVGVEPAADRGDAVPVAVAVVLVVPGNVAVEV